ncbi:hypothetical protein Sjap_007079 [Stephania japonica]|uniref:Uncharacterized protein n=1 Tax=Stephania japonica TaxID=461633 RepID=A0AAP0PNH3_9MAGN
MTHKAIPEGDIINGGGGGAEEDDVPATASKSNKVDINVGGGGGGGGGGPNELNLLMMENSNTTTTTTTTTTTRSLDCQALEQKPPLPPAVNNFSFEGRGFKVNNTTNCNTKEIFLDTFITSNSNDNSTSTSRAMDFTGHFQLHHLKYGGANPEHHSSSVDSNPSLLFNQNYSRAFELESEFNSNLSLRSALQSSVPILPTSMDFKSSNTAYTNNGVHNWEMKNSSISGTGSGSISTGGSTSSIELQSNGGAAAFNENNIFSWGLTDATTTTPLDKQVQVNAGENDDEAEGMKWPEFLHNQFLMVAAMQSHNSQPTCYNREIKSEKFMSEGLCNGWHQNHHQQQQQQQQFPISELYSKSFQQGVTTFRQI